MTPHQHTVRAERLIFHRANEDFSYGEAWDDEKDRQLTKYAFEGYSRAEIAKITGRTPDAIKKRGQRLNLRFTRDTYGGSYRPQTDRTLFEGRKEQEERDRTFIRALAVAIYRGDHLPGASNA